MYTLLKNKLYFAIFIIAILHISCTSYYNKGVPDIIHIAQCEAKKIFQKKYDVTTSIHYDSSYSLGNRTVHVFSYKDLIPPVPIVVEIMLDSLNRVYEVYDRSDIERYALTNGIRFDNDKQVMKYVYIYFRSYYYTNTKGMQAIDNDKFIINGRYVQNSIELVDELGKAYYINTLFIDSIMQYIPSIDSCQIDCIDSGYVLNGYFIEINKLELYALRLLVHNNGTIDIIDKVVLMRISDIIGKPVRKGIW